MLDEDYEKLSELYLAMQAEHEENQRKARHNYGCKTEDIQPYDNSAYLAYLKYVFELSELK